MNIQKSQESQLINEIVARKETALRQFYETYCPKLERFIRRFINSVQDVEEITQDVLFAFLENARDFTGKSSINTYLCSIAHNKIVDRYRRKKLKRILFSEIPENAIPQSSNFHDPEFIFHNKLLSQKISWIFRKLRPMYATIIKLKYIEGRSVTEIAGILTVSFKSAESFLFRARKAFVKLYVEGIA